MMNIVRVFTTSFILVALISTNAQSQTSQQSLDDGKRLYTINCANCHGETAQGAVKAGIEISIITERGGKQPPNLTDQAWDHGSTDAEIFTLIKKGFPSGMMPPFEGRLSDAEIRNVVSYVRSLATLQDASTATVATGAAATGAVSTAAVSTGAVSTGAPPKKIEPAKPTTERTLKLADYLEMPITGDMSADRVSGVLARGSIMLDEPGSRRAFLNDLTGPLYILDKQTKQLTTYLNFNGTGDKGGLFPKFSATMGYAAGLMNIVFDPDYKKNGIFYTLHMENTASPQESVDPKAGVVPGLNMAGYKTTSALAKPAAAGDPRFERELVIVEWTDRNIKNMTFEGTAREVFRLYVPGLFHPLNEITFNPAARPGDADWRVMYLGIGDAGTGERPGPMRLHAQRLDTFQGKVLRIIPSLNEHKSTSTVSENGQYRIPNDNPFVSVAGARKEIWAYGMRNPHRLTWYINPASPREPVLFAFNIGLVSWETVLIVKKGANYGYPLREGTQSMAEGNKMGPLPAEDLIPVQLSDTVTSGTVKPTYAVMAYPHAPGGGDAIANGFVYRGKRIPALKGTFVFGDITTGRIWYAHMKDVRAADDGNPLTIAPIHELGTDIRALAEETYKKRGGKNPSLPGRGAVAGAGRIDLRLAEDSDGELYVITKADGMIRAVVGVQ